MILAKSLPCYACRPGQGFADLQRIIATGDVGLTIYRFTRLSPENNQPGTVPKDTIIFYTTRNFQAERQPEMNLEIFEGKLSKCVNYCPRCKEMMRRIRILYRDGPSTDRPTDLSELFSCPPCTDIVRKFQKFTAGAIREQDSELIHLQRLTSPRYDVDDTSRVVFADDPAEADFLQTTGNLKRTEGLNKDGGVGAGTAEGLEGMKKEKRTELIRLQPLTSPRYDVDDKSRIVFADDVAEAEFLQTTGNLKHTEGINKDGGVGAGAAGTTGGQGGMVKEKTRYVKHTEGINKDGGVGALAAGTIGGMKKEKTSFKHTEGINKVGGVGTGVDGTPGGQRRMKKEKNRNFKHTEGINIDGGVGAEASGTTGGQGGMKKEKPRNLKHTKGINKDGDVGARAAGTTGGQGGMKKEKTRNFKQFEGFNKDGGVGVGADGATEGQGGMKKEKTGHLKHIEGINKVGGVGTGVDGTPGGQRRMKKEKNRNLKQTEGINTDGGVGARAAGTTGGQEGMKKDKTRNLKHTEGINKDGGVGIGMDGTPGGQRGMEKEKNINLKHTDGINTAGGVGAGAAGTTGGQGGMKNEKRKEVAVVTKGRLLKGKTRTTARTKVTSKSHSKGLNMKKSVASKSIKRPKPVLISGQKGNIQELKAMELMTATAGATEADVQSSDRTDECSQNVEKVYEFIKGNKIYKMKPEPVKREEEVERATVPLPRTKSERPQPDNVSVQSNRDGVLLYKLSDPTYLDNGWTQLPKEVVMRKVALFQMHPAHHALGWLELNKPKGPVLYRSGQELASFHENGTRLYYMSGELAMEYYKAEETNAGGSRVVVYSTGTPDAGNAGHARPRTVLAMFDYAGNGEVYDHTGQLRLKYTQNDGITLDPNIGPHTHWKWHNLNDPPVLKTVFREKQPLIKDPGILKHAKQECRSISKDSLDENVMESIEAQNAIKQLLLKKYVPFQIKMRAFKINEHFSLRIHEQSSIFLSFSDGRANVKINVGMILDPTVVVGEEFLEVGQVHGFEAKPVGSESVERLQRVVQGARAAERARLLRERRLNFSPSYVFQKHHKH